ncbi:MAG: Omp28-related outer membrane protein, partial [Bacteroidota bacterium]
MKKTTSTILLLSFFIFQAAAQQIEAVQRSLITKRTATWCPPCGAWGWTMFDNLIADNQDKAVFFAAHFGTSLLANTVGEELTDNFGAAYQPVFYLDEVNQNATSGNAASTRTAIKTKVDDAFAAEPIANSTFKPTWQNGQIKVDASVKFFQATEGDFYLGVYLVEDNVLEYQASIGNNAVHHQVLQASFSTSTWGEPLANGSVEADATFTKSFSLEAEDPATHDYEVVGVIWKKVGSKYQVVN